MHLVGETMSGQIPTQQPEERSALAQVGFPEGTMLEQSLRSCSPREGPVLEQRNSTGEKHRKEGVTEMNYVY